MYLNYIHLDESDLEGTSPSTSKLNTSTGSSGKKERHFWQYNVQAKGPKGQKINFETRIEDPHVLNDIVDPVFSGEVQLQGIKHRYILISRIFFLFSSNCLTRNHDFFDCLFIFLAEKLAEEMEMIWRQIPKNWQPSVKNWISWAKLSMI